MQNNYINRVINYLTKRVASLDPGFKIFNNDNDLTLIQRESLFFPNYIGCNSYLVLFSNANSYYSAIIDKRSLSRKFSNDMNQNIIINVRFPISMYLGTIIEGVFIKDTNTFIGEIPIFTNGIDLTQCSLRARLCYFREIISGIVYDETISKTQIKATTVNNIDFLREITRTNFITFTHTSYIRGINFYTENKKKLIVLGLVRNSHLSSIKDKEIANLKIKVTAIQDVYSLHCLVKEADINKTICIGFASVPSAEDSNTCIKALNGQKEAIMVCIYNKYKDKWRPYKASSKLRPDYMTGMLG